MRHRRWSRGGTWQRMLDELGRGRDQAEGGAWTRGVDSFTGKAPHTLRARPARPRSCLTQGAPPNAFHDQDVGVREALGRSHGWLTAKVCPVILSVLQS